MRWFKFKQTELNRRLCIKTQTGNETFFEGRFFLYGEQILKQGFLLVITHFVPLLADDRADFTSGNITF